MKPRYIAYALEHAIAYDESDPFDLFRQWNRHHHWKLHDGYKTYVKCYKMKFDKDDCNGNIVLECSYGREGNYSAYGSCKCGRGDWQSAGAHGSQFGGPRNGIVGRARCSRQTRR